MIPRLVCLLFAVIVCFALTGCGNVKEEEGATVDGWESIAAEEPDESEAETQEGDSIATRKMVTSDEMRELIGANDQAQFQRKGKYFISAGLMNSGAKTLEPLKGHPLKVVDVSRTEIRELSPLKGMPIEQINLFETEVDDLTPLEGMPITTIDASHSNVADLSPLTTLPELKALYLENAKVEDLSPLKSMNIKVLWINDCPVKDLSPLEGKQFDEINLCDTQITNLDAVSTMKLPGTLWLRNTPIVDLSPLSSHQLVSLDIQGTKVSDLAPLAKIQTLQRLNIAGAPVTDLTPLKGLALQRLIFTPGKITKGIDVVRNMKSLATLDVSFDGNARAMPAAEFWQRYDQGAFAAVEEAAEKAAN